MANYFEFFGLPLSPNVDQGALKQTFYGNSKKFHPDFHTLSDQSVQDDVLEKSTLNNQGYKTLKDEDLRLKHFLDVHGALGPEGTNTVPQDFLMEIMDVNEALMELEFEADPLVRQKVTGLVDTLEHSLKAEVTDLLDGYDPDTSTPEQVDRLKNYYLKRRYLLRLRKKI
ncbi:iron-sulfur cluster co-chaperone HscB C-terminal domain-containing protein [Neolewinella antarctica]|uniref:Molecular chaperone HscB n=1 Tax=Neolewinella antarctica TaxID=442734 RepID=A0ABX0XB95_9BACT|nr:iron-sulfur cluster co-chaperone HscB C-terminal domain-containing protein [Neolewinella antarctica]NJC26203.1 molecular chaperone HscB [Neolewinella antarctica]